MSIDVVIQTVEPVDVQIERSLRQQIKTRKLRPMERLPPTAALAKQWNVTLVAVQKAMERLAADGLIERNRKRGTFVKSNVDKAVVGVLFGMSLAEEQAHFPRAIYEALRDEVTKMKDCRWSCRSYDRLSELRTDHEIERSPTCQHLTSDLRNFSFKGIIQIHGGITEYDGAQFEFGLPTVRFGSPRPESKSDVTLDDYRFGYDCIDFIAKKGLRKVAYLRTLDTALDGQADLEGIADAVRERDLPQVQVAQFQSEIQAAGDRFEQQAHDQTLQLVESWTAKRQWPEALLVSDDIAMRGIALALIRKGVDAARRLLVVTLAHQGIAHHYGMPVVRYEYSTHAIARALTHILRRKMLGEITPALPIKIAGSIPDCRDDDLGTPQASLDASGQRGVR